MNALQPNKNLCFFCFTVTFFAVFEENFKGPKQIVVSNKEKIDKTNTKADKTITKITERIKNMIQKYKIGGIILYRKNFETYDDMFVIGELI